MKNVILILFLMLLIASCDGTEDEYSFGNYTVINNTGASITVYYGEEKTNSSGAPYFEQHSMTVNSGSSRNFKLQELEGIDCITVVSGGTGTVYYKNDNLTNPLTIN